MLGLKRGAVALYPHEKAWDCLLYTSPAVPLMDSPWYPVLKRQVEEMLETAAALVKQSAGQLPPEPADVYKRQHSDQAFQFRAENTALGNELPFRSRPV